MQGTWPRLARSRPALRHPESAGPGLPDRLIGNPHATPAMRRRPVGLDQLPDRLPDRDRRGPARGDSATRPATSSSAVYNMVPHAGRRPGWSPSRSLLAPVYTELSARTDSDYGLGLRPGISQRDSAAFGISHLPLGGSRRRRSTTNCAVAVSGQGGLTWCMLDVGVPRPIAREERMRRRTRVTAVVHLAARLDQPADSVPAEPDDLRRPADDESKRSPTTTKPTPRGDLAGDHRLRPAQLQPEPLGEADDHQTPTRPRARRRPQGAADPRARRRRRRRRSRRRR